MLAIDGQRIVLNADSARDLDVWLWRSVRLFLPDNGCNRWQAGSQDQVLVASWSAVRSR